MPWSSDDKSETGRGGNPSSPLESVINHMANSIAAALRKTPDESPLGTLRLCSGENHGPFAMLICWMEGVKACNGIGVAIPKLVHYRFVLCGLCSSAGPPEAACDAL